jgi:glycosyltransferase involved in cell wall biosynthesis
MDITTTLRWQGHDVGITRVERNCAVFLGERRDLYPDVVFVRQDSAGFSEVDRDFAVEFLGNGQPSSERAVTPLSQEETFSGAISKGRAQPKRSKKGSAIDWTLRNAKKTARAGYLSIENSVPSIAKTDLRAGAVHANRVVKAIVHEARHGRIKHSENADSGAAIGQFVPWSDVSERDVFVSMGLDWDDKSLLNLYRLRKRYRFRSVLMCYDLIPVLFPEWMPGDTTIYDQYFTDLLYAADAISCISDTTRAALENFAISSGLPLPLLTTIRLGADFAERSLVEVEALAGVPFVLFVSTLEPRKNHMFALELWKKLAAQCDSVPKLVFVGRRGWKHDGVISTLQLDPDARKNVIHLESVDDRELAWLYANSMFTLYPSIYEG